MSDGVGSGAGSHGCGSAVAVADGDGGACVGHGVLANSAGGRGGDGARTLSAGTRPRTAAGGGGHMQLLLVAEEEIASGEAPRAFRAFEGLLLGVGSLVAFEMLEAREGSLARTANVWPRLVRLRGREDLWSSRRPRANGCGGDHHLGVVVLCHHSTVLSSLRLHGDGIGDHSNRVVGEVSNSGTVH